MSFIGAGAAKAVAGALVALSTIVSSAGLPEVTVDRGWAMPDLASVRLPTPPPRMTPASVPLTRTPWHPDDMRRACTRSALSSKAKAVYKQLLEHFNHQRRDAFPGYNKLAEETGLSKSCVVEAVKELEQYGWVRVRRRMRCSQRDGDEPRSNLYAFDVFPRVRAEPDPLAEDAAAAGKRDEDATPAPAAEPKKRRVSRRQLGLGLFGAAVPAPAVPCPVEPDDQFEIAPAEQTVLDGLRELRTLAHLASPEMAGLFLAAARRARKSVTLAAVVSALADLDEKQRLRLVPGSSLAPWSPAELADLALRFVRRAEEPKATEATPEPKGEAPKAEPKRQACPPTADELAANDAARLTYGAMFLSDEARAAAGEAHARSRAPSYVFVEAERPPRPK